MVAIRIFIFMGLFVVTMLVTSRDASADPEPLFPGWNEWSYGQSTLGFHGYFRTSVGGDSEGGSVMPVFIAPGAQSRYRLGNESDTNIEVALDYKYYLDGMPSDSGRYVQLLGMISDYESNPNYGDVKIELREKHVAQSFIKLGNVLGDGTSAWFGRRYYDRRDIHMIDHFWLNVAQGADFGGGVEGVPIGPGRLDIAAFKNEDSSLSDRLSLTNQRDDLNSYSLDMRYHGLETNKGGDLTLWGLYSYRPEVSGINYDSESGFGIGGWHTQQNVLSGRMVTGFAYRQGTAMQQGLFNSRAIREDQGFDLDEAFSVELNNDLLIESGDDYAVQWASVIRREERGVDGVAGDKIDWVSTGVRPVFFLNDYVSIATELGVDYVNNELIDEEGFLGKGTVALQLTRGRGYFERPMIKLFATGATWSDDFEGRIANGNPREANNFADDTSGMTFGIQFEAWW